MTPKSKMTRTQIADLPENAVELSENELRIVAGGLRAIFACNTVVVSRSLLGEPTDWNTNGDHDPD
jgi:hypothetical protein